MGFRAVYKWVCVVFLLAASALLLATTISSPVVGDIGILKVMLTNHTDIRHSSVTFGTFGHCILDVPPDKYATAPEPDRKTVGTNIITLNSTDQDLCFPKTVGYAPAKIMAAIDGGGASYVGAGTADALTNAMILHPIALAVTFIAFILSLFNGRVLPWIVTLLSMLAFSITLAATVIDFVLFGIIKNHVNGDGSGSNAYYSIGAWTILAAVILLIFPVFFGCFGRPKKHKELKQVEPNGYTY